MKNIYLLMILLIPFLITNGNKYKKSFSSAKDWDNTLYDWKIDVTTSPGDVKLLKTELITDEMGVTTGKMKEIVIGKTCIKKEFLLDNIEADKALLLIHWNVHGIPQLSKDDFFLWVIVNDNPIKLTLDYDRMLTGSWVRCDVPIEFLKEGVNTIVLKNDTDFGFAVSIEASRIPNRSAKSVDGGKTWDYDHLGNGGFIDGEYLIRLRLARYPSNAEIKSDYIELASMINEAIIKPEIKLKKINISLDKETPAGTNLFLQVRGGSTPSYQPDKWSSWYELDKLTSEILEKWKFFQWKIELQTENHELTPILKGVHISAEMDVVHKPKKNMKVVVDNNQKIIRGYYHYTYQDADEYRLGVLRDRYNLEEVSGVHENLRLPEFRKFRLLASWVRNMWRDGWDKKCIDDLHTPWDALIALSMVPQHQASGMCSIYASTFIQTVLSVGLQARGVILDHHFVSEVWSNEYKKWITFDIGNSNKFIFPAFHNWKNIHLNTLETHKLVNEGKLDEIRIVSAAINDSIKASEAKNVEGFLLGPLEIKARFGIPLRNNYLTSWMPGELEHGFIQYHYDGYLWWKDTPISKYEEYTYQSSHKRDFYWTLNQAQIFLTASNKSNELKVFLDTVTPNFEKFQVRINGKEWKDSPSELLWKLSKGDNVIEARPVNKFNKNGIISKIVIKY